MILPLMYKRLTSSLACSARSSDGGIVAGPEAAVGLGVPLALVVWPEPMTRSGEETARELEAVWVTTGESAMVAALELEALASFEDGFFRWLRE